MTSVWEEGVVFGCLFTFFIFATYEDVSAPAHRWETQTNGISVNNSAYVQYNEYN